MSQTYVHSKAKRYAGKHGALLVLAIFFMHRHKDWPYHRERKCTISVREEAFEKIVQRCVQLFGVSADEIGEDTRFIEDLGARSGNVSQMTNFLEDEFDVEISFMEFRRRPTIGMAADYIEELCEE